MAAWLLYGQQSDGELLHISEVVRGEACACFCPHCQAPLAAKKGNVKIHHFAHIGSTCAYVSTYDFLHVDSYVDTSMSLSQWTAWKQQDLEQTRLRLETDDRQYTQDMTQLLVDIQAGRTELELISQPATGRRERSKVRQTNHESLQKWDGFLADHNQDVHPLVLSLGTVRDVESCGYESIRFQRQDRSYGAYYAKGFAWPGELWWPENKAHGWTPVWLIKPALRLVNDYHPLRRKLVTTQQHLVAFKTEQARFAQFRLYFLLIEFEQRPPLFKIGITSRTDLQERIKEIQADLRPYGVSAVSALYQLPGQAYLESYFKQKYAGQQQKLGKLTEYFTFDNAQLADIQAELDKLSKPEPATLDRSRLIKRGMDQARQRGVHVGRPAGIEAQKQFLTKAKSKQVMTILTQYPDWSMRQVAKVSGIALNTVCKVKHLLDNQPSTVSNE